MKIKSSPHPWLGKKIQIVFPRNSIVSAYGADHVIGTIIEVDGYFVKLKNDHEDPAYYNLAICINFKIGEEG